MSDAWGIFWEVLAIIAPFFVVLVLTALVLMLVTEWSESLAERRKDKQKKNEKGKPIIYECSLFKSPHFASLLSREQDFFNGYVAMAVATGAQKLKPGNGLLHLETAKVTFVSRQSDENLELVIPLNDLSDLCTDFNMFIETYEKLRKGD